MPAALTAAFVLTSVALAWFAQPPLAPPASKAPTATQPRDAQAEPALPRPEAVMRFGAKAPLPKAAGAIRLATYNVENLFDDVDDPALTGEHEDKTMTKPADACREIAAAIRAVDADVLALQEVESEQALRQFRDRHLQGMGYDHVVSVDAGDERGIEQAVLSRFPLSDVRQWIRAPLGGTHPDKFGRSPNRLAGKPITFHRSPLRVTVTVPSSPTSQAEGQPGGPSAGGGSGGYQLTLFVVHQKSGGGGDYWREREATRTIELARELTGERPDANVIILGDFNAVGRQQAIKLYTGAGFIDLLGDRAERAEFTTHASGNSYDRILFSPAAWKEALPKQAFVLGTVTRPAGVDFRTTPNPEGWASDHYPVVVDITPIDQP